MLKGNGCSMPSLHPLQLNGGVLAITNLSAACVGQTESTCDLPGTSDFGQRSPAGLRLRPTLLMGPVALIIRRNCRDARPTHLPPLREDRSQQGGWKPYIGKRRKPVMWARD
jgi:hypothetical protein